MLISDFILQPSSRSLVIKTQQQCWVLSYEYLRVYSPAQQASKQKLIGHKKEVKLINIEVVGKHGYRFCFDDSHSFIINDNVLIELAQNYQDNWQTYLAFLEKNNISREAKIDIVNLS